MPIGGLLDSLCSNSIWYFNIYKLSNTFVQTWHWNLYVISCVLVVLDCPSVAMDISYYNNAVIVKDFQMDVRNNRPRLKVCWRVIYSKRFRRLCYCYLHQCWEKSNETSRRFIDSRRILLALPTGVLLCFMVEYTSTLIQNPHE